MGCVALQPLHPGVGIMGRVVVEIMIENLEDL